MAQPESNLTFDLSLNNVYDNTPEEIASAKKYIAKNVTAEEAQELFDILGINEKEKVND